MSFCLTLKVSGTINGALLQQDLQNLTARLKPFIECCGGQLELIHFKN
jgi:hypothetical protein